MRIEPASPRTLFFNDSVFVGYVRGGFIEVASQDSRGNMNFYSLDQRPWVHAERAEPFFARRKDCLNCHASGTLIRSVFTRPDGVPLQQPAGYDTDQRTPFDKLWGGWYVTGNSGSAHHMGEPQSISTPLAISSPYSDIAALMVFEHQTRMMNLITRIGQTRRGSHRRRKRPGGLPALPRCRAAARPHRRNLGICRKVLLPGPASTTKAARCVSSISNPPDAVSLQLYDLIPLPSTASPPRRGKPSTGACGGFCPAGSRRRSLAGRPPGHCGNPAGHQKSRTDYWRRT